MSSVRPMHRVLRVNMKWVPVDQVGEVTCTVGHGGTVGMNDKCYELNYRRKFPFGFGPYPWSHFSDLLFLVI